MIKLPNVTLCAVDGVSWELAARSLEISRRGCQFADMICFSLEPAGGTAFKSVLVEELKSLAAYTPFLLKRLNEFIKTDFALVTQWDGYIIHPESWDDEFLTYDYIGAKWARHHVNKVGNGGFSLRSKRLLEALQDPRFETGHPGGEDELICRFYRQALEQDYSIRFAPEAVADRFSYECSLPCGPSFGFHGIMNLHREVPADDLEWMASRVPPCVANNPEWKNLQARLRTTNPSV
jgi:hypothetical protein